MRGQGWGKLTKWRLSCLPNRTAGPRDAQDDAGKWFFFHFWEAPLIADYFAAVAERPGSEPIFRPAGHDLTMLIPDNAGGRRDLMVAVAEGRNYCGLDEAFTRKTRRIGMLGRTCNAVDADRTDNSNATVYTILQEMGLPLVKPGGSAPGWGTNLHRERTAPERLQEIRRQINRFENLPSLDQANFMRRLFGG